MGYKIATQLPANHRDRAWTDSTVRDFNEFLDGDETHETVTRKLQRLYSERRIADQRLVVVADR